MRSRNHGPSEVSFACIPSARRLAHRHFSASRRFGPRLHTGRGPLDPPHQRGARRPVMPIVDVPNRAPKPQAPGVRHGAWSRRPRVPAPSGTVTARRLVETAAGAYALTSSTVPGTRTRDGHSSLPPACSRRHRKPLEHPARRFVGLIEHVGPLIKKWNLEESQPYMESSSRRVPSLEGLLKPPI
jgi:hypothetical protein